MSQESKNGLMHRSFWSCSKSYSSWVDSEPSLFRSIWPNIHLASVLHAGGNRAAAVLEFRNLNLEILNYGLKLCVKRTFRFLSMLTFCFAVDHYDREPVEKAISNGRQLLWFAFNLFREKSLQKSIRQ